MRKWLNDFIVQILLTGLFIVVFYCCFMFECGFVLGDMFETASMEDFTFMSVIYTAMIAVTMFCGIWCKNIVANLLAGAYGLLWLYAPWDNWLTYYPLFASWESRVEILFNAAHVIIFVTALVGLVRSGRALYLKIKQTCLKHREYS